MGEMFHFLLNQMLTESIIVFLVVQLHFHTDRNPFECEVHHTNFNQCRLNNFALLVREQLLEGVSPLFLVHSSSYHLIAHDIDLHSAARAAS